MYCSSLSKLTSSTEYLLFLLQIIGGKIQTTVYLAMNVAVLSHMGNGLPSFRMIYLPVPSAMKCQLGILADCLIGL